MQRHGAYDIAAASVIVVGLAMMCHEWAHVLTGWMAGGSPTLLTTTEVLGDFDSLSPAAKSLFGASGSLVNLFFCVLGWWVLRRRPAGARTRLFAWLLFAVNGMLVTAKMTFETLTGFGDWMTILGPLRAVMAVRVVVAALGVVGLIFMVRRSGRALAGILPDGETRARVREAIRLIAIGAAASALLVLGGTLANPIGLSRGSLLSLAAGLGPFFGMLFGVRQVPRVTTGEPGEPAGSGWPWRLAAVAVVVIMWFVVGPGIDPARWLP